MSELGTEYKGDSIKISEQNKAIGYVAQFYGIDKTPFVCYYNRDTIYCPMPSVACFDSNGRAINVSSCYSTLFGDYNHLLKGDIKYKASLFEVTTYRDAEGKRKTLFQFRKSLDKYLKDNDIRLLDDSRLTLSKLPKSEYYFFVDFYWVNPEESFVGLRQIDSICAIDKRVTFIKIHNTNIKGTPFITE